MELIAKLRFSSERRKFEFLMETAEKYPNIFKREGMPRPDYIYEPTAQRIFEKCPVCGGTGEPYHCAFSYRMADFDYPFQPFKLWMKCTGCGNLYTEQFPEEFLALSERQKEIVPNENSENAVSNITSAHTLAIWSDILNKLRGYTDKKALLEVGIGNGELLSVALEMGYEPNAVEIVEESAQRVSNILGIPIHCGDFLTFKSDKTFPIIIMGDVIEHVTDPEAALKSAFSLLDDDGVLWLSTPNYESSFTRLRKFTDPMWLEPYHITYFNYSGLEALLEKCGFEVREYSVSSRYNGSMELIITKK
ncbi:MAG: class I SAM-dependent methyltransferase [Oscillospiraceae bacterium]|nr:class I SAM-dependent methyltransferase [Oscillospiraceae bacterium]